MTALPSHVQELADRVAAGHGVEVLELDLRGQGRGRVLSVVLDAEEPVEADVVELVSKDLSRARRGRPGRRQLHPRGEHAGARARCTRAGTSAASAAKVAIVRRRGRRPGGEDAASVQGVVVDADDEAVVLEVDGGRSGCRCPRWFAGRWCCRGDPLRTRPRTTGNERTAT